MHNTQYHLQTARENQRQWDHRVQHRVQHYGMICNINGTQCARQNKKQNDIQNKKNAELKIQNEKCRMQNEGCNTEKSK